MNGNGRMKNLQLSIAALQPNYWAIVFLILPVKLLGASPLPQNPFEAVANGVLTVASSAAEFFENGAAIRKDMGISNDFFQVNHKAEAGMGKAILKPSDSDDDDSDERRKRKRRSAPLMHRYTGPQQGRGVHTHRGKRSPCHTMMQPSTPSDGAEDAEDGRRRSARSRSAAQKKRNASTSAKSSKNRNAKSKAKKSTSSSAKKRYRRQAEEVEYLDSAANEASSKFSQHVKEFAKKVQGFFESVFNSMSEVVQRVKQTLSGEGQKPSNPEDI